LVQFSKEQLSNGVAAGLWTFTPARSGVSFAHWNPTAEGTKLGLPFIVDDKRNGQLIGKLKPGFSVSVKVTGLAADASGAPGRIRVEATVKAKIAHPCFSTGLPFSTENGQVSAPIGFTFVLFDDGWRAVR